MRPSRPGRVFTGEIPPEVKGDTSAYTGCVAGAATVGEIEAMLTAAGFEQVRVEPKDSSREFLREWRPGSRLEDYVVSADITAIRP
ncbi:MAG: hypothetical protein DRJ42_21000 [Deltaproteobacteria bacterium]|nr:MAG: hypothetical protein DRJ42_21000 [Deltaproteobacteria bacterium]